MKYQPGPLDTTDSPTYFSSGELTHILRATPHAPGADFRVCHRHKALPNLDDIRPLKALLDYTALVHEEHPLREPGVNGIKLYLGEWRTSRV